MQMLNFSEPARVPPVPSDPNTGSNGPVHQSLAVQLRGGCSIFEQDVA